MLDKRTRGAAVLFVLISLVFGPEILSAQQEVPPAGAAVEAPVAVRDKNITLDFKDADIRNILKIISYKAGVNIVTTPEVVGNVTIRLVDVPWENALDTIVKTYGFAYEWLNDRVIMVSTTEKILQQRKDLDDAAAKESIDTQVFTINFSGADNIKASIEKLLSERGKITVESRTNTLIVTDTKTRLSMIAEVIKNLDRRTPQVMIEARIIETTLGNSEKLGINWSMQVGLSGAKRPVTLPFTTKPADERYFPKVSSPSELERVATTETSSTGDSTTSFEEKTWHQLIPAFPDVPTDLFTFGTLDFTQLQAVLEILNQRTDTKIVSNPRITTLVNKEANIFVGSTVPIPQYEYSKESGTRVVSGYETQKIGVGLTVVPNVNEQDYITLTLKPTVDEITGFTGPNNERPIVSTRQAETNVMVKDGQTLVIGGLISEKKIKYKKKVPILGDIPLLSYIFSKKEDTINKTDLLIFITPHVVRDNDFMTSPQVAQMEARLGKEAAVEQGLSKFEEKLGEKKALKQKKEKKAKKEKPQEVKK